MNINLIFSILFEPAFALRKGSCFLLPITNLMTNITNRNETSNLGTTQKRNEYMNNDIICQINEDQHYEFLAIQNALNLWVAYIYLIVFTQFLRNMVSFAGFFFDLISIQPQVLSGRYHTECMVKTAFTWICRCIDSQNQDER